MKLSTTGNPCTTSFMAKASKPGNMPQHTDFEVTHTFYYIQFLDGFMLMDYNQIGKKHAFKKIGPLPARSGPENLIKARQKIS